MNLITSVGPARSKLLSGSEKDSCAIRNLGANVVYLDTMTDVTPNSFPLFPGDVASWKAGKPCYGICPAGTENVAISDSLDNTLGLGNVSATLAAGTTVGLASGSTVAVANPGLPAKSIVGALNANGSLIILDISEGYTGATFTLDTGTFIGTIRAFAVYTAGGAFQAVSLYDVASLAPLGNAPIVFAAANPQTVRGMIVPPGATSVFVFVQAYTSGTCNITISASVSNPLPIVANTPSVQSATGFQLSDNTGRATQPVTEQVPSSYFGTGTDGTATISTFVTMTSAKQYVNLTIASGGVLYTSGFPVYVSGTLTFADNTSFIGNQGFDAGNGANGVGGGGATATAGGTAGTPGGAGPFGAATAGGVGGAGSPGAASNGSNGLPGGNITGLYELVGAPGSVGGAAGSASGRTGGNGGNAGTTVLPDALVAIDYTFPFNAFVGGTGGGGGGGAPNFSGDGSAGAGGGGGGGGGVCMVIARTVAGAGNIISWGGRGGNGGVNSATTAGGAGGGSGGGGGVVVLIYESKGTATTSLAATGGGAGVAGAKTGVGTAGANGNTGNNGLVYAVPVKVAA